MCNFCNTKEEIISINDKTINLGVLGEIYGSFKFYTQSKQLGYNLSDENNNLFYEYLIQIKYCPFCGKQLESE